MENTSHSRLSLILGLSIPALIIIIVAIVALVPKLLYSPKTDFIFASSPSGSYYNYGYDTYDPDGLCYYHATNYGVKDGKLSLIEVPLKNSAPVRPIEEIKYCTKVAPEPLFYRYFTVEKRAEKISLADAQKFTLRDTRVSPDGYEVAEGNSSGFPISEIFGGRGNYYQKNLRGHGISEPIVLDNVSVNGSQNYYDPYYNFRFIGWIIQ